MKKIVKLSLAVAMMSGLGAVSAQADDGMNIISDVKFKGQIRPRYQFTDIDNANDSGHTLTNRTNLSISGKLLGVDGLGTTIELNSVNDFGTKDVGGVDIAKEATVAKMTQANVTYTTNGITGVVGRMTVNLDNQRFIGSVGWKQNFQTLDLFGVIHRSDKLDYTAVYVYGVNAIGDAGNGTTGVDYTGGTTSGETSSVALNASYKVMPELKVTGYAYMLASYSDTYGVAATGKIDAGAKISYRAEYAMQTGSTLEQVAGVKGDSSLKGNSMYYNIDVAANISGILLGANYEVLGAADTADAKTSEFQTPLATKHKFNGWADQFLSTPSTGLVDMNLMAGYTNKTIGVAKVIYHSFTADDGGATYGSEIDFLLKKKVASNVTAMLKGAMYTADTYNADTTKVWLMADYRF